MSSTQTLITAEQYRLTPDDSQPSELVRGRIVTMNPPTPRHGQICGQVYFLLRSHVDQHDLGHVLSNDSGIVTERNPDTVRGADIAYYSYQRVQKGPLPANYLDVAPEVVFEVLSPGDRWSEVHHKSGEYLDAGILAVCVLDDEIKTIHIFYPDQQPLVLKSGDRLNLANLIDGFEIPIARFFE